MTNPLILLRDKCRNMSSPQTKNESNENFTYFSINIANKVYLFFLSFRKDNKIITVKIET